MLFFCRFFQPFYDFSAQKTEAIIHGRRFSAHPRFCRFGGCFAVFITDCFIIRSGQILPHGVIFFENRRAVFLYKNMRCILLYLSSCIPPSCIPGCICIYCLFVLPAILSIPRARQTPDRRNCIFLYPSYLYIMGFCFDCFYALYLELFLPVFRRSDVFVHPSSLPSFPFRVPLQRKDFTASPSIPLSSSFLFKRKLYCVSTPQD